MAKDRTTNQRSAMPSSKDDFAGKIAKGSAEFMEQTSHLFHKMSFFNCTLPKTATSHKDDLIGAVIHVPSAAATIQSDMTEVSVSDQPPHYACEGAIAEWLRALEARKAARNKVQAVHNLRQAVVSNHKNRRQRQTTASSTSVQEPEWDWQEGPSYEFEGIVYTRSDAGMDCHMLSDPVYSKSLF